MIGKLELMAVAADEYDRQSFLRFSGLQIKIGVDIEPIVVGLRGYMGPEHCVWVEGNGDIKVQLAAAFHGFFLEGNRGHVQSSGPTIQHKRLTALQPVPFRIESVQGLSIPILTVSL